MSDFSSHLSGMLALEPHRCLRSDITASLSMILYLCGGNDWTDFTAKSLWEEGRFWEVSMACQHLPLLLWNISELRIGSFRKSRCRYLPLFYIKVQIMSYCLEKKKELLWHSYAHSFVYCLCSFCTTMAELSYSSRKHGLQSLKSSPVGKTSADLCFTQSKVFTPWLQG